MMLLFATLLDPIWCDPPITPYEYSQQEAQEFRSDIKAEYQTYISELEKYLSCMSRERARAMSEGRHQANRYGAFLDATEPSNDIDMTADQ